MNSDINLPSRIFVTGTDTGIGKSIVSLLLMRYFQSKGLSPFYFKPFQTGCVDRNDPESDPFFIYRNLSVKAEIPADSVLYCHKNPKAPLFAARDESANINVMKVVEHLLDLETKYSPIVIEGSGGVLVPVTEDKTVRDVISLTEARPVIVARAGLGTINHTLMTIESLVNKGINPLGVVFNTGKENVNSDMIEENSEAIYKFSGIRVAGCIGFINDYISIDGYFPICDILFNNDNKAKNI